MSEKIINRSKKEAVDKAAIRELSGSDDDTVKEKTKASRGNKNDGLHNESSRIERDDPGKSRFEEGK